MVLTPEGRIFLIHLETYTEPIRVTIYVASQYEEVLMRNNIVTPDNAFDFDSSQRASAIPNLINQLSEYVFDLIEEMQFPNCEDVIGTQVTIKNIDQNEDLLVYLLSVAERIVF